MHKSLSQLTVLALLLPAGLIAGDLCPVPAASPSDQIEATRLAKFLPPSQDLARVVEVEGPTTPVVTQVSRSLTPPSQRTESPLDAWITDPELRAQVHALRRAGAFD